MKKLAVDRLTQERVESTVNEVLSELESAWSMFPRPQASAHEGFAVLLEEVDELKDAVWLKPSHHMRQDAILKEARQVAAMAIRLIVELNDE